MINVSRAFRQELYNNRRKYLSYADITLKDGTVLNLTNEDMLMGGFSREEAVSDDGSFSALGSAIIGSATLSLNNMHDDYTVYDFTDADVVLYLALNVPDGSSTRLEKFKVGTYTVDETGYSGSAVTLSMLDYMEQFDRPYSTSQLEYPATLSEIIRDACTKCGITLLTQSFPHSTYTVSNRPTDDAVTYREVIGWAAAIAGCFAKCDVNGRLEIKWFNQAALEYLNQGYDGGEFDSNSTSRYTTGDALDGGTFDPWNNGSSADGGLFTDDLQIHIISNLYSQDLSIDDVIITGVRVIVKAEDTDGNETDKPVMSGQTGYVVEISGNEFITETNAQEIVNWLGTQLIGLRFRKANVTHASDPSIEAGDVAILWDKKGHDHPILITRMSFAVGSSQTIVCGAETPSRNSSKRFGSATKAFVEARKLFKDEKTAREQALRALSDAINAKEGLYLSIDDTQAQTSGSIFYLHDHPNLIDSGVVWKMTKDAFAVTTYYNRGVNTVWNAGLTVDGTLITQILDTIGINFDWGTGGTLTLGGNDNGNGLLRMLDASGNQIGGWNNTGITINKGSINLGSGNFVVTDQGAVTAKSFTANSYVYVDGDANSMIRIPFYDGPFYGGNISLDTDGLIIENTKTGINNRIVINRPDTWNSIPLPFYVPGSGASIYYSAMAFLYDDPVNQMMKLSAIGITQSGTCDNETRVYPGYMQMKLGTNNSFTVNMNTGEILAYVTNRMHFEGSTEIFGDCAIRGNLSVTGTKPRLVETEDYGERYLYCYETPTPMFGDIGEGVIGEDGLAYIQLDPTFLETVATTQYQIFLQAYGDGKVYVKERHESYFVVEGTAGLAFGWEAKARQRDYENYRLENKQDRIDLTTKDYGALAKESIAKTQSDYGDAAVEHIDEIAHEREVAAA